VSYTRYISKYVWHIFSESFGRMSGICQGYTRHMFSESLGRMSGICQGYTRHMFSESFVNMSGIYPTYSFACEPPCSSNAAIGRLLGLRHRDCECHHGCLMFSSKRLKHEPYIHASMFLSAKNHDAMPCNLNLKCPWWRSCHYLALGDGENVKPEVGTNPAGAAAMRAAQAPGAC
jgi:hypothetical protein